MARARMRVPNSPVRRNVHLIGAGNKFPNIKDANGVTQFRLSVIKQAETKRIVPSMDKLLEQTLKSTTSLTRNISKSKGITYSR